MTMATYCYQCCKRIKVEDSLDIDSFESQAEDDQKLEASAFDFQEEKLAEFFCPDFSKYLQGSCNTQNLESKARLDCPSNENVEAKSGFVKSHESFKTDSLG